MTFKINIIARELASALSACGHIIDTGAKIPILKTVRITIADGRVEIVGTNTAQTVMARAACAGEGAVCLDFTALETKVKNLRQGEPVNMDGDGQFVTVTQGRTRWKLPCMAIDDFPGQVADPVFGDAVSVAAGFMDGVNAVSAGVNPNDPRDYLRGVYFGGDLVGTDGHMLARIATASEFPGVIVPLPAIRAASSITGEMEITANDRAIQFASEWITIKSQLIEGNFPDHRRIVPNDLPGLMIVDRDEFKAAVQRAASIRADGEKSSAYIPVVLKIRDGEVEIFASNRDGEEGSDYVSCDRQSGDDCDIRFSGGLLIKAIDSLDCDTLALKFRDRVSPMIMSPVATEIENIRVVMPRSK